MDRQEGQGWVGVVLLAKGSKVAALLAGGGSMGMFAAPAVAGHALGQLLGALALLGVGLALVWRGWLQPSRGTPSCPSTLFTR